MAEDTDGLKLKQFARRGFKIRQKLQAIEDELIEAGFDDFAVATDEGSFHWTLAQKPAATERRALQPALGRLNSRTKSGQ